MTPPPAPPPSMLHRCRLAFWIPFVYLAAGSGGVFLAGRAVLGGVLGRLPRPFDWAVPVDAALWILHFAPGFLAGNLGGSDATRVWMWTVALVAAQWGLVLAFIRTHLAEARSWERLDAIANGWRTFFWGVYATSLLFAPFLMAYPIGP